MFANYDLILLFLSVLQESMSQNMKHFLEITH